MARTGYQTLTPSPWPFSVSISVLGLCSGMLTLFGSGPTWTFWFFFGACLFLMIFSLSNWWSDVVMESTFLGEWSSYVLRTYVWGFRFFILSEGFFFMCFLSSLIYAGVGEKSIQGVGLWPPRGVAPVDPMKLALLNSVLLVGSSFTANWAMKCVEAHNKIPLSEKYGAMSSVEFDNTIKGLNYRNEGIMALFLTIVLGVFFSSFQFFEYYWCSFCFSDGIYGSIFFIITGFHGMHVIVGIIFLVVCMVRLYYLHFSYKHFYFGMWAAVWYWHFVDCVWIMVYTMVYLWVYYG